MDNNSLFHLHQSVQEEKMEFLYKGVVNEDVVNAILEIIKKKFQELEIEYSLRKKIYNIAVECLENINDHRADGEESDSIFVIGKQEEVFYIGTGNFIDSYVSTTLSRGLEKINSLDREGLKILYKQKIKNEVNNNSNDAGIGLIDIAIKANSKLEYRINPFDDDRDFFALNVKIKLAS